MTRKARRPFALFAVIVAAGAGLGLVVRTTNLGPGPAYAIAGAVFAVLATLGMRYAFGETKGVSWGLVIEKPAERVKPDESAVPAYDRDGVVAPSGLDLTLVVDNLEIDVFDPEGPIRHRAGGAVSPDPFGDKVLPDVVEVGHGNGHSPSTNGG